MTMDIWVTLLKDVGVPMSSIGIAVWVLWKMNERMAKAIDALNKKQAELTERAIIAIEQNTQVLRFIAKREAATEDTDVVLPAIETDKIPATFRRAGS